MTKMTKLEVLVPSGRVERGGKERVDSEQQWRRSALLLLALGGPQLISTSLFILVIVPPTYHNVQFGKNSLILESQLNF
jgi:hypothetical protein